MTNYLYIASFLLLSPAHAFAQQCNPNNCPNLLVNGDFNGGNTGFTTTLIYNTFGTLPASNHYYVHSDAYAVYGNWCGMSPDSTPFMIVDGSYLTGTIVWEQTVPAIQPSVGFDFCLLITNLDVNHSFTQPNIRITVIDQNGDTLLDHSSGNIPAQNSQFPPVYIWTVVSSSFTSLPTSTSATVSITQLNYNSGGNDFGLEDITLNETSCGTLPVAAFSGGGYICPGTCASFTNLSSNATSYQWYFNGATPSTSTDTDPQNICYNTPGSYDVTLVAYNANDTVTLNVPGYITVYPYPPAQGIAQSGDTLFANGGAVTYQWYLNGAIITGATDSFYVAAQGGNYNVVCTDSNGCEVEAVVFDVVAAVQNLESSSAFYVFPNPAEEEINVMTKYPVETVTVFNLYGEEVLKTASHASSIDISSLAPGCYFIEAKSRNENYRKKFVKSLPE
jgi:PKD repeat protein